jgi:hypothetical protein
VCALNVLGRAAATLPPIELVASPPPDVSPEADAFVRHPLPTIHLVTSSAVFRDARCTNRRSLVRLASVIAHEEWHVRRGPGDEKGAYEQQLLTLMRLGAGPDSVEYQRVRRAMLEVLEGRHKPPAAPPAGVRIARGF